MVLYKYAYYYFTIIIYLLCICQPEWSFYDHVSSSFHKTLSERNSPKRPEDQRSSWQSVPAEERMRAVGSEAACYAPHSDYSEYTSATNEQSRSCKHSLLLSYTSKCMHLLPGLYLASEGKAIRLTCICMASCQRNFQLSKPDFGAMYS